MTASNSLFRSAGACLIATLLVASPALAQRGDTVVRVAGRPVHNGLAKLVSEVSIGALDGPDELMFGDVAEIAVAGDGSIYVFDRKTPALRQYDATGKYVRTLGGRGNGPGEYLTGGGLAVHPDGRVLLWDTGNWRINVYSASGATMASWLTPSGASGNATASTSRALVVDTAGRVYYRRINFAPNLALRMTGTPTVQWVRLRADGAVIDTLDAPSFTRTEPAVSAVSPSGTSRSSAGVPFAAQHIHALSRYGYFVTAIPDRYAFELLVPGRPVLSVRREVPAAPVTSRERDSARRDVEERMKRVEPLWRWNGPEIPRTKAHFGAIAFGDDGRIWIPIVPEIGPRVGSVSGGGGLGAGRGRLGGPPPSGTLPPMPARPARYDVFEPDGTYLGQVEIPARVSTVVRRGNHVWGVQYDEDDVPYVKRFRIVWP